MGGDWEERVGAQTGLIGDEVIKVRNGVRIVVMQDKN